MSLLQHLSGNSTNAKPEQYNPLIEGILVENESVFTAYKTIRDFIIFTNKRLILIDVQGITGKKKSFKSVPYSNIQIFIKESAGTFDLDNRIDLYVLGYPAVLSLNFSRDTNIDEVYQLLSDYILKDK